MFHWFLVGANNDDDNDGKPQHIIALQPTKAYVLGQFVCKSVSYLQGVAVSASIYTMVAVTMDR